LAQAIWGEVSVTPVGVVAFFLLGGITELPW